LANFIPWQSKHCGKKRFAELAQRAHHIFLERVEKSFRHIQNGNDPLPVQNVTFSFFFMTTKTNGIKPYFSVICDKLKPTKSICYSNAYYKPVGGKQPC